MTLAPEEKTLYAVGGPKAQSEFDAGLQGFATRAFRGLGVVFSEPFEVSDDADSVQMLTRSSQVGEFYVMGPPDNRPKDGTTGFMDIIIYNEESDRHVRITWEQALKATLTVKNGNYPATAQQNTAEQAFIAENNGKPTEQKLTGASLDAAKQFARGAADGGSIQPPSNEWLHNARLLNEANKSGDKDDINKCFGAKAFKKAYIVVARPFIEHLMHSAVVAVAGRDTGATLFGPAGVSPFPAQTLSHAKGTPCRTV